MNILYLSRLIVGITRVIMVDFKILREVRILLLFIEVYCWFAGVED
jgi:hypothetical protein